MVKQRNIFENLGAGLLSAILLVAPLNTLAQSSPSFSPDKLIEDTVFSDTKTFGGAEGVQKFLEVRGSVLANTAPDFLVRLKEPNNRTLKVGLDDPRPDLPRLRTAAELIWDASVQSGLNPQVIVVTLNKEQSLITGHQDSSPEKLQKALDRAMGFDCPDATGCGDLFPGFYFQLFGNFDTEGNRYLGAARSLMKSFSTSGGRGPVVAGRVARVGDVVTLDNTTGGPYGALPQQTVTITNNATAALYRYTPHVYNGNYNFWRFFNEWFRYPNGTIIALSGAADSYIIQDGTKQLLPSFVATARALDVGKKVTVSPNEFDTYPTDKVLGPADNTVVKVLGDERTYVFLGNTKHPASSFVLSQRGLSAQSALSVTAPEFALFELGSVLPPKEGTVIRGQTKPEVFLVEGSKVKLYSAFTFAQRKAAKKVVTVPDDEISTYERGGFVPPLDGTLVKAPTSSAVYLVEQGLKRPLTAELFKNRGYSFKAVVSLSGDEVAGLGLGAYATPKDRTFFATPGQKDGSLYIFKEGSRHPISAAVAKQRGITPDYVFGDEVALSWSSGIPVPPRDGTAVKGVSSQTVYYVSKGQLRPMTPAAFKRLRVTAKKIMVLPQAEVESYAKGETLER